MFIGVGRVCWEFMVFFMWMMIDVIEKAARVVA